MAGVAVRNVLALSTCWQPYRGAILPATLDASRRLGFRAIEIGVSPAEYIPEELALHLDARGLSVVSVHNIADRTDLPPVEHRGDGLGSLRRSVRRRAVARTLHSMALARHLRAPRLILHLGSVPVPGADTVLQDLGRRIAAGEDRGAIRGRLHDLVDLRIHRVRPHLDAVRASLDALLERGAPEVALCIETRYFPHEIPDFYEMGRLLSEYPADRVGYWHDVGHAMAQQALGLVEHDAWLRTYGGRLRGMHLHDIRGLADHAPPGTGEVDFSRLREHLRPDTPAVLELEHDTSIEALEMGLVHLRQAGYAS